MRALAVAVVTAAAAEAAIAAASAAAELVRLTHVPYELERKKQYLAAVKIQSVYRGHLVSSTNAASCLLNCLIYRIKAHEK